MSKKVHYSDGCPWADGSLQMADTRQTTKWKEVTCKQCLRTRSQRAAQSGEVVYIFDDALGAGSMAVVVRIRRKGGRDERD